MSKYFTHIEFACKCGCKKWEADADMVKMLDNARHVYGLPIYITSGFRCFPSNALVGGSPTSSHLTGHAVDIQCGGVLDRFRLVEALLDAGFNRIGIGGTFIHVDNDPDKGHSLMWLYK